MRMLRTSGAVVLAVVVLLSLFGSVLTEHRYDAQYREHANATPSHKFLLGADELGRDRFSRLVEATRVSLLFAPVTALLATMLASFIGLMAGFWGGWTDRIARGSMDLFLSLPWIFLLLTLRALLPLNTPGWKSLLITFLLLAFAGWAYGARVIRVNVAGLRDSPAIIQARACGLTDWRLMWSHILPGVRPVVAAQFWILVPVFLLTEANLGMLGLGISEPMPSLGNMLADLQNYQKIAEAPWMLAPAILLVLVVASLHFVVSGTETWE